MQSTRDTFLTIYKVCMKRIDNVEKIIFLFLCEYVQAV